MKRQRDRTPLFSRVNERKLFLLLKLFPHLLKRIGELNVIMFTWLALYHSQAWRYISSHILFRDVISKISNSSAGLAITPQSTEGVWSGRRKKEKVSLSLRWYPTTVAPCLPRLEFHVQVFILHTHAQPVIQKHSCSAQGTRTLEISRHSHNLCTESVPIAVEILAFSQDNWSDFPFYFMVGHERAFCIFSR